MSELSLLLHERLGPTGAYFHHFNQVGCIVLTLCVDFSYHLSLPKVTKSFSTETESRRGHRKRQRKQRGIMLITVKGAAFAGKMTGVPYCPARPHSSAF